MFQNTCRTTWSLFEKMSSITLYRVLGRLSVIFVCALVCKGSLLSRALQKEEDESAYPRSPQPSMIQFPELSEMTAAERAANRARARKVATIIEKNFHMLADDILQIWSITQGDGASKTEDESEGEDLNFDAGETDTTASDEATQQFEAKIIREDEGTKEAKNTKGEAATFIAEDLALKSGSEIIEGTRTTLSGEATKRAESVNLQVGAKVGTIDPAIAGLEGIKLESKSEDKDSSLEKEIMISQDKNGNSLKGTALADDLKGDPQTDGMKNGMNLENDRHRYKK